MTPSSPTRSSSDLAPARPLRRQQVALPDHLVERLRAQAIRQRSRRLAFEESGHGSPRASGIEFDPAGLAVALEHDLPALADAVERLGQLAGAPEGLAVDRDDDEIGRAHV